MRIAARDFKPDRSQRRCLRANADLSLRVVTQLAEEHYQLYRRYLQARHAGGGMDPDDGEAFREFLGCSWGNTEFWEFRRGRELLAARLSRHVKRE